MLMFDWQLHGKIPENLRFRLSLGLVSHKYLLVALFSVDRVGEEGPPRFSQTLVLGKQQPIILALAADEAPHIPC